MTSRNANVNATVDDLDNAPSSFEQLVKWLLQHTWYVHHGSHIRVALPASQIYNILARATKPSVQRLGLRKLFARGRRYFIRARPDGGFQMMTTCRTWWHPKRRTVATTLVSSDLDESDGYTTRMHIHSRIRLRYLLEALLYPTFFSSLVIFTDWATWIIVALVIALYGLSWTQRRLTAQIEAHEIIYFIETVLADFRPEPVAQLADGASEIVIEDDFVAEWERFVEEKRNN